MGCDAAVTGCGSDWKSSEFLNSKSIAQLVSFPACLLFRLFLFFLFDYCNAFAFAEWPKIDDRTRKLLAALVCTLGLGVLLLDEQIQFHKSKLRLLERRRSESSLNSQADMEQMVQAWVQQKLENHPLNAEKEILVGGHYVVRQRIGSGSFGEICIGSLFSFVFLSA